MVKVRIIAPLIKKREIVDYLHDQGCVDIRRGVAELADDAQDSIYTELNNRLIRVAGALRVLKKGSVRREKHIPAQKLMAEIDTDSHLNEIFKLEEKAKKLEEELIDIAYPENVARYFEDVDFNFDSINSERLDYRAFITEPRLIVALKIALSKSKVPNELVLKELNKKETLALIAYDRRSNIDQIVSKFKTTEIDLRAKDLKGTPDDVRSRLGKRRIQVEDELKDIAKRLDTLSKESYSKLVNYKHMLEIEMDRANVPKSFKRTDHTFVVEGWMPKKTEKHIREGLNHMSDGKCLVEELETDELAPTLLSNNSIMKPFEYVLEFFSVPRSDEINPTLIYMISLPIFYGLMISDVGYGVMSLILSTYLTKITSKDGILYNVSRIWQLNAIAAIIFGFITDQYFGLHLNHYFTTFVGFDWIKNITFVLIVTLVFGIAQVTLGLILGFINKWKHGHRLHAISKLTSIVVLLAGTVAISGAFFHAFGGTTTEIAGILSVVALIATVVTSGIEAAEITNLIVHPLSYARILGFGFAGIILALLIDIGFTPNINNGIISFVIFLIIFLVLHFLNMILSIFEGVVQGIRLNFIEFFTKFYMGNGVKFRPFSYKTLEEKRAPPEKGKHKSNADKVK